MAIDLDVYKPVWQHGLLTQKSVKNFQDFVWEYYNACGRSFVWRKTTNPYHILVSEIMLQQTQTHRVENKFEKFLIKFPDFYALSRSSQEEVIRLWQGLGYNRRALSLQKTANKVVKEYGGNLPNDPEVLVQFPGIGEATAGSICAFAFNKPTIFIETNIRAVFIHYFFSDKKNVSDKQIQPLVIQTLEKNRARCWYYALMDLGVILKKKFKNPARKSKHYSLQGKFVGSDRQIRGAILKFLLQHQRLTFEDLASLLEQDFNCDYSRASEIINILEKEQFIRIIDSYYVL